MCEELKKKLNAFFSESFSPTDVCQSGSPGLYNILCFSVCYACYIIQLLDWWIMRLWITWCSVFIWRLHLRCFFGRNAKAACFSRKKLKAHTETDIEGWHYQHWEALGTSATGGEKLERQQLEMFWKKKTFFRVKVNFYCANHNLS